ncbi:MAG: hypothetical protein ACLP5H_23480 [Desulfomonilaceae bacterium]
MMITINEAYSFVKGPPVGRSPMPPSIDRFAEEGFRVPFQEHRPPFPLERWDHPDGRYRLVNYKAGGIYTSEDVNDPQWKEMLGIAFRGEKPTIVFTSEAWFKLRVNNPTGNIGDFFQLLSPEETPKERDDWYDFTDNYVPPVPVPVFKGTRMILENGRAGKLMFIRTYRAAPYKWVAYLLASSKRTAG